MMAVVLQIGVLLLTLMSMSQTACLDGLFSVPGSSVCFKRINEIMSWNQAKRRCVLENLVLAHPSESIAVALRQHLWDNYGCCGVWVDASGTGTIMRWNHDGSPVDQELAVENNAKFVSRNYCLLMTLVASGLEMWPRRPFASGGCSAGQNVLCQAEDLSWCRFIEEEDCSKFQLDCPKKCQEDAPFCKNIPPSNCKSFRTQCPKRCP